MGELGEKAEDAHREVGRLAGELGIEGLLAIGEHAAAVTEGALAGGLTPSRAVVAADHEDALSHLRRWLRAGDRVLVKGSRATHMERVVEALSEEAQR
jgi:UDP-N-acetylmuramoyl-tripeptide--D-alanyl-D-alanine ligase